MRHEQTNRHVIGYAHQAWLAGLGVLGTLRKEGSRLFNDLVEEGKRTEQRHGKEGRLAQAVVATKEAYQKKLEAQFKEWDKQLDQLMAKTKKARADARTRLEEELARLKDQRAVAQKKLDELRHRGEDAWEELKHGVEKAWDDINNALGNMVARFK